jgi:mono/diheme cytochrome c family protein
MDSNIKNQNGTKRSLAMIWSFLLAGVGCLIAMRATAQDAPAAAASSPKEGPTYLRDVQPIFMGNCSRCHNQESRFVYNWLDYKTAYADRWEIKRRVWDSWDGSYFKEAMPIANSPESLQLTEDQRLIIRDWVKNGAPRGVTPVNTGAKSKADRITMGSHLFASICAACHQPTGLGRPNVFPPLAGSDFLNADKSRAIGIVIHGRQGEVIVNGQKFNSSMPSFPLNDEDIADVLTYVYNSFGNSGLEVTPEEVKTVRANPSAPAVTTQDTAPPPAVKNPFE